MTLKHPYTGTPLDRCPYGDECPAEQELKRLQNLLRDRFDAKPREIGLAERIKKGSVSNG